MAWSKEAREFGQPTALELRGEKRVKDVTRTGPEEYEVAGRSDLSDVYEAYEVRLVDGKWYCTCLGRVFMCSHIIAAQLFNKAHPWDGKVIAFPTSTRSTEDRLVREADVVTFEAPVREIALPEWADLTRWEKHQRYIYEEICARFDEGNSLVVADVPTGGGKSLLAYMVHQYLGFKTLYVCHSIVLQEQFAGDFPSAVIMGRSNYPPVFCEEDEQGVVPSCGDCDWDKDTKLCSYCPSRNSCPYVIEKDIALRAELAVANTAYFIGECNQPRSQFSNLYGLVVADECDTLEKEVMGQVSITIPQWVQHRLGLRPPRHKTKESSWAEWFEYAIPLVHRHAQTAPRHSLKDKRHVQTTERLLETMVHIKENIGAYVYTGYDQNRIEFKPVTVDHVAPRALWSHGRKWLCMSATVISPEEFVGSLGYEGQWASVFAPSTFAKERRPINVCPSARMVSKMEADEWPKMKNALVAEISRHPGVRILVHAHSYKLTNALVAGLSEEIGRDVFSYSKSDDKKAAIEDFEATEGAVLVAPSLDRGYDGKDDLVRVVIICKVPAPYLGDKQISTRLFATPGGDLWYSVLTARTLVQMAGRAMRHEEDHCEITILDSQFGVFYGKWKKPDGSHRLFPSWFVDALDFDSTARFELRQLVKNSVLKMSSPSSTLS